MFHSITSSQSKVRQNAKGEICLCASEKTISESLWGLIVNKSN